MEEQQIISQEGYDKLQEELNYLSTAKRREIADRIEKAKDLGDLSENAEYSEAKDAQALNDGRIMELAATLKNVVVVSSKHSSKEVMMGAHVTAEVRGQKREFTIVSFNEANPSEGKISNESPLGLALLGKKKGEAVIAETPRGDVEYKIIDIR